MIFSSNSIRMPSALRALQLVTRLAVVDISIPSYELFKAVMTHDNLTDQHWEAARLAVSGALGRRAGFESTNSVLGELTELLKFLDYNLGLQGAGEDHGSSITFALKAIAVKSYNDPGNHLTAEYISSAGPSVVRGIRSIVRPGDQYLLRWWGTALVALTSDQWFNSPVLIMEPEDMPEFCEHLTVFIIDDAPHEPSIRLWGVSILFGMLRSPEWRKHIVTRFWCMFAYCAAVEEGEESFRWCLRNAVKLLEFTKGLPDNGEGLKWWYGALWFHYDKLDTTAQDEVKRIAKDMSSSGGLPDLNLYLNLIEQEVANIRQELEELPDEDRMDGFGMELRARLIALEGNHDRLTQITRRHR